MAGSSISAFVLASRLPYRRREALVKVLSDRESTQLVVTGLRLMGYGPAGGASGARNLLGPMVKRLLPAIRRQDVTPQMREALHAVLARPCVDDAITMKVIKLLEQVGDGTDIEPMRRLVKRSWSRKWPAHSALPIRKAALECLPYLEIDEERARLQQMLLRPSDPTVDPRALLRAGEFSPSNVPAEQLLRAQREP